jgi:hypothetical protein
VLPNWKPEIPASMTTLLDKFLFRPAAPGAGNPENGTRRRAIRPGLLTFCRLLFVLAAGVGVLLAAPCPAPAQQAPPQTAPRDTAVVEDAVRSPRGAFLRSLVLPGWGHAWVGSPVRGGAYFVLEAGALWMTYKSHQQLREARRQERWLRDTGQLLPNQQHQLTRWREDQVEDWVTVALFLLLFSGADAFVSAHLADFDERVSVAPAPGGGVQVRASLPVGGRP